MKRKGKEGGEDRQGRGREGGISVGSFQCHGFLGEEVNKDCVSEIFNGKLQLYSVFHAKYNYSTFIDNCFFHSC